MPPKKKNAAKTGQGAKVAKQTNKINTNFETADPDTKQETNIVPKETTDGNVNEDNKEHPTKETTEQPHPVPSTPKEKTSNLKTNTQKENGENSKKSTNYMSEQTLPISIPKEGDSNRIIGDPTKKSQPEPMIQLSQNKIQIPDRIKESENKPERQSSNGLFGSNTINSGILKNLSIQKNNMPTNQDSQSVPKTSSVPRTAIHIASTSLTCEHEIEELAQKERNIYIYVEILQQLYPAYKQINYQALNDYITAKNSALNNNGFNQDNFIQFIEVFGLKCTKYELKFENKELKPYGEHYIPEAFNLVKRDNDNNSPLSFKYAVQCNNEIIGMSLLLITNFQNSLIIKNKYGWKKYEYQANEKKWDFSKMKRQEVFEILKDPKMPFLLYTPYRK